MMPPEEDWTTVPQGPPQPPTDIYSVLNTRGSYSDYTAPVDVDLITMAMLGFKGEFGGEGVGEGVYGTGYQFTGSYKRCMADGKGTVVWADKLSYSGEMVNHAVSGFGKYKYPNGDEYEGEVSGGIRQGVGTYTKSTTGEVYSGEWLDGVKHGKGKMQYSKVSSYEGAWVAGKPHGVGTMVYPSKSTYNGSWYEGVRHGNGVMTWVKNNATSERYDGAWKFGDMDGSGTHWYFPVVKEKKPLHNNYYTGGFKKNQRNGSGSFVYTDGSRYEGNWSDNIKQGEGAFLYDTGVAYSGEFRDDKPVSVITMPEKPALSRYIPLNINDLLMGEVEKERVLARVHTLLSRNYQVLHKVFHRYAGLNLEQESRRDHFTALSMLQFWKLAKDTSLLGNGVSLAAVDRIFLRFNDSQGGTALTPSKPVLQPIPPRSGLTVSGLEGATTEGNTSKSRHLADAKSARSATGERRKSARSSIAGDALRKTSMSRKASGQSYGQFPTAKTHRPSYKKDTKPQRTNIHASNSYMYFREFVEAVIRIAHLKFSPFPHLTLADKLALCLQSDLQPPQAAVYLNELTEAEPTLTQHRPFLMKVYALYTTKAYNNLPLHRTHASYDAVLTLRQFLVMCKEVGVIGEEGLSLQSVLGLFETPAPVVTVPEFEVTAEQSGLAPFPPKGGKKHRLESVATLTGLDGSFSFDASGDADSMAVPCCHLSTGLTERSKTPETHRGDGGHRFSLSGRSDVSYKRELEAKLQARKQHIQHIMRGASDASLVTTVKSDQELLFEEFIAALVKVARLRYPASTASEAFSTLLSEHLLEKQPLDFYGW